MTLHRICISATGLVLAWSAAAGPAAALDCAALLNSPVPFELTLEREMKIGANAPRATQGHLQVFRKGEGATGVMFFEPGAWIRTHYLVRGFPDESFVKKDTAHITYSYTPAPTVRSMQDEMPLAFHVTMKRDDGSVAGEQDHAIRFMGHHIVELAGCTIDVVKAVRLVKGTFNDKYSESETEFWFSPQLQTAVYLKSSVEEVVQTYTAQDISVDFKPVE